MKPLLYRILPRIAQRKLLLRYIRFDEAKLANVRVHLAETTPDVKAAMGLLHEIYTGRGIIKPNKARLHVTKHNALPSTMVFVAKKNDQVIATLSLARDTPIGLPIETTHRPEVDSLRAQGMQIAEVVGTACDEEYRGSGLVFYLYRIMLHSALRSGLDYIVMRSQPKGALLYEELMACDQLGEMRPDPTLNNKAFIALALNIKTCEGRFYERFAELAAHESTPHYFFFKKPLPQVEMPEDYSISAARLEASAALVRARFDLFRTLPRDERHYYRHVLPNIIWPVLSSMHIRSAMPINALPEPR